ncbi:unnamed protein product [Phaeothamnion confervicola]
MLFSEVAQGHGGMTLVPGSHFEAARMLWRDTGATLGGGSAAHVKGTVMARVAPAGHSERVREAFGNGGDVVLCHALLLHSRTHNVAPTTWLRRPRVRIICNAWIRLHWDLDFAAAAAAKVAAAGACGSAAWLRRHFADAMTAHFGYTKKAALKGGAFAGDRQAASVFNNVTFT